MAVIVRNMDMPSQCYECRLSHRDFIDNEVRVKCGFVSCDCSLKSVEGLIDELEIYASNQCDSWDNSVVNGAIDIIKEYCGIGE